MLETVKGSFNFVKENPGKTVLIVGTGYGLIEGSKYLGGLAANKFKDFLEKRKAKKESEGKYD